MRTGSNKDIAEHAKMHDFMAGMHEGRRYGGHLFIEGRASGHLFIEGRAIYSYGYHFPIALRLIDGWVFNTDKYSVTTSRHQSLVKTQLSGHIVEANTKELKELIAQDVHYLKDVMLERL